MISSNTSKKYKIIYNKITESFRICLNNNEWSNIRISKQFITPSNITKLELKKITSIYIITKLDDSFLEMIYNILCKDFLDNLTLTLVYELIKTKFYEQEISL